MVFLKPDNLCRLILLQILLLLGTLISMAHILCFLFSVLTSTIRSRLSLQLEIAALRHQLSAYRLQGRRPRIAPPDRLIWSVLAKSTVEKYKPHGERLPSATWRTFLDLHLKDLVAVNFFVGPT
jgi:hypothetical protein